MLHFIPHFVIPNSYRTSHELNGGRKFCIFKWPFNPCYVRQCEVDVKNRFIPRPGSLFHYVLFSLLSPPIGVLS